ncbi:hypothetical protein K505DRAFT_80541 [Melanomma pulvis-pyrius CBS 109.77]|uniref:Uncharacterized protein n=1 Tax=Melanomma pulvis-pyrius CBS 109.77 TaxID=1314802 RepID=A0A6A6XR93_9PLEO|nr:hypothetical protein K505DRAFT_80541 [Melanomma pulvis-pyrius CBS 109.77]
MINLLYSKCYTTRKPQFLTINLRSRVSVQNNQATKHPVTQFSICRIFFPQSTPPSASHACSVTPAATTPPQRVASSHVDWPRGSRRTPGRKREKKKGKGMESGSGFLSAENKEPVQNLADRVIALWLTYPIGVDIRRAFGPGVWNPSARPLMHSRCFCFYVWRTALVVSGLVWSCLAWTVSLWRSCRRQVAVALCSKGSLDWMPGLVGGPLSASTGLGAC